MHAAIETRTGNERAAMNGHHLAFSEYLARTQQPVGRPALWRAAGIEAALSAQALSPQRLTRAIALTRGDAPGEFALNETVSLIVQSLGPGECGRAHSHSFWHLYVVLRGKGASVIGQERIEWSAGDSFYVPPWSTHDLRNLGDAEDAIVYSIQNLPAHAFGGTLVRREDPQRYVHVTSDGMPG